MICKLSMTMLLLLCLSTWQSVSAAAKTLLSVADLEQWRCTVIDSIDGLKPAGPATTSGYVLIINGGYFDLHNKPVGYFKRDGRVINEKRSKKLSGSVLIDAQGTLDISDHEAEFENYTNVIQCGPLLIDRGGKMGIRKNVNQRYDRMVLIKLKDGTLHLIFHPKIDLFDLAELILKRYPNVDLALNLDGGPSCCLMNSSSQIQPGKALPYYLRFDKVTD